MVEKRGGFFQAAVEVVKSLTRDHTGEDVSFAQRVLTGEINPEDREEYKAGEASRIIRSAFAMTRISVDSTSGLNLLPLECITMIEEVERLPDEDIDERIRLKAAQDLARWRQPKP